MCLGFDTATPFSLAETAAVDFVSPDALVWGLNWLIVFYRVEKLWSAYEK